MLALRRRHTMASDTTRPRLYMYSTGFTGTCKRTPEGAGTHTGHTGAHGKKTPVGAGTHTRQTQEPHKHKHMYCTDY